MDKTKSTHNKPVKEPEKGQEIIARPGGNGRDNSPGRDEAGNVCDAGRTDIRGISDAYKESEEDFRNSMDACPFGIRVVTAEGELIYANRAALDICGCKTIEELKAIPQARLYDPDSYAAHWERKEKRKRGEEAPSEYEISITRADGEARVLQVYRREITWGGEKRFMSMYQDVTGRRKLEASNRFHANLFKNVSDAIYSSDADQKISSWNKAAEDMYGWREEEVIGKDIREIIKPAHLRLAHEDFMFMLKKKGHWKGEDIHERKNGEKLNVLMSVSFFRDEKGGEVGAVTVCKDITGRIKAEEALEESREMFTKAFHDSPVLMLITSQKEGRILEVNDVFCQATGYSRKELLGRTTLELNLWNRPGQRQLVTDLSGEKGKASNIEVELRVRSGEIRVVDLSVAGITLKDEPCFITIAEDITDRKKAEEELTIQRDFNLSMFNTAQVIILVLEPDGRIFTFNPYMEEVSGYKLGEVRGKYWFDTFIPQRDRTRIKDYFLATKGSIQTKGNVNSILTKDGREREIEWYNRTLKNPAGKLIGVLAVGQDVTERRRLEAGIRYHADLVKCISDAIISSDMEFRLLTWNKAAEEMYGWREEEVIGKDFREIMQPVFIDTTEEKILDSLKKNDYWKGEMIHRRKNGEIFHGLVSISTMRDENGRGLGAVTAIKDITGRIAAEAALQASEERYRNTLDKMMEGCQIIDRNWRYIYVNDAAAVQGRCKKEELLGHTMMEVYPGIEKTEMFALLKNCMEERVPRRVENEFIFSDGSSGWFELSMQPVPEGVFILSLDITERRKLEGNNRYQAKLVESVSDAIISGDREFKLYTWNKAAEEMYGWRVEEVLGKDMRDIMKPVSLNASFEEILYYLKKDGYWRGEDIHRRKNGESLNVLISVSMMKDLEGNELGAVLAVKDITDHKKAEEKYQTVVKTTLDGFLIIDLKGRFLDVNDSYCQMVGYKRSELLNMSVADIEANDTPEVIEQRIRKVIDTGSQRFETRHRRKDGRPVNVEVSVNYHEGKEGQISVFVHDVTARRQDEERINHLNLTLRSIRSVNQQITREKDRDRLIKGICDSLVASRSFVSAWIVLLDDSSRPVTWAQANAGAAFPEIIESFKTGDLPRCVQRALKQQRVAVTEDTREECRGCPLAGIEPATGSMTVRLESGDSIYGILCASMPRDLLTGGDERSLFSEVADDIAFALRNIELGTANDLLQQERLRAAKLESIGTLAGGIAHDFNNLLTGIMGNIGLAKSYLPQSGNVFEMLDEAEKAAARSRDLTQQLLTFARGGRPIKKMVNISNVIKDAASFGLRGSKVRLELSLPDDLWQVEADEGQISQVIHNLVINADDSMPQGGTLKISAINLRVKRAGIIALSGGNYVRIDISDTGSGITPEHLQKIFEPYFTTKQHGSGLGLTTAYSIIKNHGGSLFAESDLNKGSTFHIYLPASKKTRTGGDKMAAAKSTQAGGKVLIMDDDATIRKMLINMLNLAGYEVEATADGVEAIEKYKQAMAAGNPFTAVIMDLTVPGGMGGKEAIGKLLEIDPAAAVIVSSGYTTDAIMSEYKKYGFSAVIAKPYSIRQLQETIIGLSPGKKKQ